MFTVYLADEEIGKVARAGRGIRFTYSEHAIDNAKMPALSLSLPKRAASYSNRFAGAFFRNLLPEQSYRRLVAGATDADPGDSLGLLGAIGGECAGAVSIWPAGQPPPSTHEYSSLSTAQLESLFTSRGSGGLGTAIVRGRLSLPGVQEKIALLRDEAGGWKLPKHGAVTSHILKQATMEFPDLLANELFCMSLARASELDTSPVGVAAPGLSVLSVERFDRVGAQETASAPLQKVHQEDFCQALGIPPERKYERDGGPGLAQCIRLIRENSSLPARDIPGFVRQVGFNYLIGNEDAHAKNVALLYTPDGLRLAPHYDLVSTELYPSLDRSVAMKIGRTWDIRNIQRTDWKRFAGQTGFSWNAVRALLLNLTDRVASSLDAVEDACHEELEDDPTYSSVREVVTRHVDRMRRELT